MRDAVIVEAVRTPIGKGKANGALHGINAVDLLAHSLKAVVERTGIDAALIDDVIGGAVSQVGEQSQNVTRTALLAAGYPESVPGTTVDRQCGSSQQAVHFAAQGVIAGAYDIVVAAGVESMSRVPMGSSSIGRESLGVGFEERYPDGLVPQGISAELIAAKWGLSRTQLDEFSASSHRKAALATESGYFTKELATLPQLSVDEAIRPGTTVETLAGLRTAFESDYYAQRFPQIDWSITAGNSSPLSDGSSAVMITTSEIAAKLGLTPKARLHSFAVLARAGLTVSDIDLFEVNEAFAPVVLSWAADTGVDLSKVNVHGGAIALGHPLGGSGTRIMTTLVNAMEQRGARYGLQTMCEAGGLANATILERLG
eukprot:gene27365-33000_t